MKKIYGILAAALMSVSVFATPEKVPQVSDLAANYNTIDNIVLAVYFDEQVCNDVVFAGTYNEWNTNPDEMTKFEELAGFDGWYVAQVPFEDGAEGKPVQLKSDGTFDWDYQTGDVDAWINMNVEGSKEITVSAGYSGESNEAYPEAGAYIYEVAYFKNHNTPCEGDKSQQYTIILLDPFCEEEGGEDFVPEVMGGFNSWTEAVVMSETIYKGAVAFTATIKAEPGKEFKFRGNDGKNGWDNEFKKTVDGGETWENAMGNELFPEDNSEALVFDFSNTDVENATEENPAYKYALCGVEPAEDYGDEVVKVLVKVTLPAGAPEAGVEIIGDFDGWTGTAMTAEAGNVWTAIVEAKGNDGFKFREAGTWDNEPVDAEGNGMPNALFGANWNDLEGNEDAVKVVEMDLSEWTWKANTGIADIVLDAQDGVKKVVVDGVIYIQKADKLFNVMGAQVR